MIKDLRRINDNFLKLGKDIDSKAKRERKDPAKVSPKGTPPGDMSPFDPEWWEICRDENAPGIPHDGRGNLIDLPTGIDGCLECFTMCTSHPEASDPSAVATCAQMALTSCVIPEATDEWNKLWSYIFPTDTCSPWSNVDVDTWQSTTCQDPITCSNECARFCPTKGYAKGTCETAGDIYYCNCSD